MDDIVKTTIKLNFEDIKTYSFPKEEMFGLIVDFHDDVRYEFLLNIKEDCDKLLCLGSGATPKTFQGAGEKPYFNRWKWDFGSYSTVHFNDPTTYITKEIGAGFGIGTADNWYLKNISLIVLEIANNLNVENKNLTFFGSSAGGFTSLMLGTLVPESKAISDIPQLNVKLWWPGHYENIKKYLLKENDDEVIAEKYGHRLNVVDLIKKMNYIPKAIIVMDVSHKPDFDMQYSYFLSNLNGLDFTKESNRIISIFHGVNLGHQCLYKDVAINLVNNSEYLFNSFENLNQDDESEDTDNQLLEIENILEDKVDSLSSEVKNVTLNFLREKYNNRKYKDEIKSLKTEIKELTIENNKFKEDYDSLSSEVKDITLNFLKEKSNNRKYIDKISSLENVLNETKETNESLISSLNLDIEEIATKYLEEKEKNKDYLNRISDLEYQLANKKQ